MQSVMILGRQPALGMAELESLYGPAKLTRLSDNAVQVDIDPCLMAFDRLGGSIKFCKLLTELNTTNWAEIQKFLVSVSGDHSQRMPEGKMNLGLSVIGHSVSLRQIEATGLTIKKTIRQTGRSVRLVPNKELELNSAQVIHNKLTGPTGWELVLIRAGDKTVIAQTVKVQDIGAYRRRDQERPYRDSKVGMLPPKLAQIIINLSAGRLAKERLSSICDIPADAKIPRPRMDQVLLDPFCGSGVILQEAALMGYEVYGSDMDQRMVSYSQKNLTWLAERQSLAAVCCRIETGDATSYAWKPPVDMVATEAYLGRPFTSRPDSEILAQTVTDCNMIIKRFLQNVYSQLQPETRLCIAVPSWQIRPGEFKSLPLIDQIEDLGYNRVSFEHVRDDELRYYRSDQVVARQLLVITRK